MLNRFPAIKLTVLFVLGMVIEIYFGFSLLVIILLLVLLSLIGFITSKYFNTGYSKRIVFNLIPILIGALIFNLGLSSLDKYPFEQKALRKAYIVGQVDNISLVNNKTIKLEIISDSIYLSKSNTKKLRYLAKIKFDEKTRSDIIYNKFNVGDKVLFTGNILNPSGKRIFTGFDYKKYLYYKVIVGVIYCKYDSTFIIKKSNKFSIKNVIINLRQNIDVRISKLYSHQGHRLIKGLLLGDTGEIEPELSNLYSKTGLSHILAVSGLHIGLVIFVFYFLFSRLGLAYKNLLTIVGIIFFWLLWGNNPSVVRASLMGVIYIFSKYLNREYSGINSLFITLLIVLIFSPLEIFSLGLHLSFVSVLFLLIFMPLIKNLFDKLNIKHNVLRTILGLIALTISAQIGVLPIILLNFYQVSFISVVANIFIVPLSNIILLTSAFTVLFSYIWFWGGLIISSPVELLVQLNDNLIHYFGSLDFSVIEYYNFSDLHLIIYYSLIFIVLIFYRKLQNKNVKIIFVTLISTTGILFFNIQSKILNNEKLNVLALDVGQGDSFLILFPNKKVALIDAGNIMESYDSGLDVILPTIKYLGIEKLDYVFISHIDSDHYLGLTSLLGKIKIEQVHKPPLDTIEIKDVKFENLLKSNNIKIKNYKEASMKVGNAYIKVFDNGNTLRTSSNDKSGIVKLVYGTTSFLFMGDASVKREKELISEYGDFLQSDVLKVGHHGSKTSTSAEFLEIVKPKYSILSCGALNLYNFPNEIVLERLKDIDSKILRTDEVGTFIFESDGKTIKIFELNN